MSRSYLFVPGDSERKLAKAVESNADAIIIDLEDSVSIDNKSRARELAAAALADFDNAWVRINPLSSGYADDDLAAVVGAAPVGIVLPKPRSADDAVTLAERLERLERANGMRSGQTQILALCTEVPAALLSLGGYVSATERLTALSWGAEDLSEALGAMQNRDAQGNWLPAYEMARSLCLVTASAAGVAAIDTVYTDFKNLSGLAAYAANARRDGFSGMLAIHPAQVEVINAAFDPTPDEVAFAKRVVALFAADPAAGVLSLDGKMLDRPHLEQAKRLLALAETIDNNR
ncbi:MAG: CoA ester lyase [Pseudomonadota bacterium]